MRSYERGERVYVAMLARGYGGTSRLDAAGECRGTPTGWARALTVPVLAAVVAGVAVATS